MAKERVEPIIVNLEEELSALELERFMRMASLMGHTPKEHTSYILFSYLGESRKLQKGGQKPPSRPPDEANR